MRFAPRPATSAFFFALGFLVGLSPTLRADWKDDVGATRLGATFSGVPTSAGIVSQAEASDASNNNYLPDAANPVFAGKTIINKSTGSGTSGHATAVGSYCYGLSDSLLPTTTTIHAYNANSWIVSGFLNYGTNSAPVVESARVQNHSWIAGADLTEAEIANIDQRLDFAINRDGFVCVAGVNNGTSTTLPLLLANAYNHITVGLTNGEHSAGFTAYDGTGRIKPDIVAPDTVTSFSTPKVSSAAGVLAARVIQSPHSLSAGPDVPRLVKALLLAGASKEKFPSWARTTARPLDLRYGAGELNLLLAYRILETGRVTASASALTRETGWTTATVAGGGSQTYFFEVPAGAAAPFSVALTWHRLVNNGGFGPLWSASPVALVNLDLKLHAATGFTLGSVVDQSASTVDNVEHIYASALPPGRYALVVSSPSGAASTAYALAWRATPTVTIAATTPDAREQDGASGVFTVTRSGSTATPLFVPLTVGGTAQAGAHYTALPASVLIPAGSASTTVIVTPVADTVAQGDRTVVLGVAGDYSLAAGSPASAVVTVRDKPYDSWCFAHFTTTQLTDPVVSGDAADPDGDGLANLLEYALAGDPMTADASGAAPVVSVASDGSASWLTLTYTQPAGTDDLTYLVEWSDDLLAAWQSGGAVSSEVSRTAVSGGERVVVRAQATLAATPRQFLRLRITRQ